MLFRTLLSIILCTAAQQEESNEERGSSEGTSTMNHSESGNSGPTDCGSLPDPLYDQLPPLNERPLNERSLNERPLNERPLNERPLNERPLNEALYTANDTVTVTTRDMTHLVLQGQAYKMTINKAYGSLPVNEHTSSKWTT